MEKQGWGRAHAAAHDFTHRVDAETVAARYRVAPRWAGYDIDVRPSGGKWLIAARLKSEMV